MSTTKHPGINKGSHTGTDELMELVVERSNMQQAYRRVVGNKGAAGVDGMTVDQLRTYLKTNWEAIKTALLNDSYQPQGVRIVMIPKPSGGERQLGIPTVVDRLIQQALHQVLGLIYDPTIRRSQITVTGSVRAVVVRRRLESPSALSTRTNVG